MEKVIIGLALQAIKIYCMYYKVFYVGKIKHLFYNIIIIMI